MIKLKDMNAQQLRAAIRAEAGDLYTEAIDRSINLAEVVHAGQIRKDPVQGRINTPYIEHPERNILRVIRWGRIVEDEIVGIALHDAVEDGATVFAPHATSEPEAREVLRLHIGRDWNSRVLMFVDGVTNDYESAAERRSLTDAEKFARYWAKVEAAIRSCVGVFIIKLTDFVDNAGSLHHTPAHEAPKARRLATKYLPLVAVFRDVALGFAEELGQHVLQQILAVLDRIETRLTAILAA